MRARILSIIVAAVMRATCLALAASADARASWQALHNFHGAVHSRQFRGG